MPGVERGRSGRASAAHESEHNVSAGKTRRGADRTEGRYMAVMCRKHTMTPNNTSNIDNFERMLPYFGRCRLMALAMDDNNQIVGPNNFDEALEVKSVTITDAWRVSIHDNTRNALEWDDEPIIPNNELKTSPVLELLENLRELHDKRL